MLVLKYIVILIVAVASRCGTMETGVLSGGATNSIYLVADQRPGSYIDGTHDVLSQRRSPIGEALQPPGSGFRLCASRPVRTLTGGGGKPSRTAGRFASGLLCNHVRPTFGRRALWLCAVRLCASPPRLYYVIVLRRLLC